jgi:hypothetical protein
VPDGVGAGVALLTAAALCDVCMCRLVQVPVFCVMVFCVLCSAEGLDEEQMQA